MSEAGKADLPSLSPQKKHIFRWRKRDIPPITRDFVPHEENSTSIKTPFEYFKFFWTDDVNKKIAEQTNLYSVQKTGSSIKTDHHEIEKYIGMHLRMGVIQLPSYRMYWSNTMRYPAMACAMPLKKFDKIKRFLHFVDNASFDEMKRDKLYKVRPVIDSVRHQCLQVLPEEVHSVDEQIIPAKTTFSGIRQYNPKKPHKFGLQKFSTSWCIRNDV